MTEPTSSMTYKDLYTEVARRTSASVVDAQLDLQLGVKDFLRSYPWSFTCPVSTLTLAAASDTTDLPDDFAELVEWPSYPASSVARRIVKKVTSKAILDRFARSSASGDPSEFALEAKAFVKATGQRWMLRWWRTPDTNRTLSYCYRVIHVDMTNDTDYPVGGPEHNLAILAAGMAQWELRTGHVAGALNALYRGEGGELAKSIIFDQRIRTGVSFGRLVGSRRHHRHREYELGTLTETS